MYLSFFFKANEPNLDRRYSGYFKIPEKVIPDTDRICSCFGQKIEDGYVISVEDFFDQRISSNSLVHFILNGIVWDILLFKTINILTFFKVKIKNSF